MLDISKGGGGGGGGGALIIVLHTTLYSPRNGTNLNGNYGIVRTILLSKRRETKGEKKNHFRGKIFHTTPYTLWPVLIPPCADRRQSSGHVLISMKVCMILSTVKATPSVNRDTPTTNMADARA